MTDHLSQYETWPCPLPGEANLKKRGDPLVLDVMLSSFHATKAQLVATLSDPDVLAGKHLPQGEQDRYRAAQQSVIDARAYAEAHAHEHYIWR